MFFGDFAYYFFVIFFVIFVILNEGLEVAGVAEDLLHLFLHVVKLFFHSAYLLVRFAGIILRRVDTSILPI